MASVARCMAVMGCLAYDVGSCQSPQASGDTTFVGVPGTQAHHVTYDDGDSQWHDLGPPDGDLSTPWGWVWRLESTQPQPAHQEQGAEQSVGAGGSRQEERPTEADGWNLHLSARTSSGYRGVYGKEGSGGVVTFQEAFLYFLYFLFLLHSLYLLCLLYSLYLQHLWYITLVSGSLPGMGGRKESKSVAGQHFRHGCRRCCVLRILCRLKAGRERHSRQRWPQNGRELPARKRPLRQHERQWRERR